MHKPFLPKSAKQDENLKKTHTKKTILQTAVKLLIFLLFGNRSNIGYINRKLYLNRFTPPEYRRVNRFTPLD